jgi:intron-binding protein aquarius
LTRTNRVGYLRDVRRLTVALSRARLGFYILGRREVFESCYELREAFDILFKRPDSLRLVTGELYPTTRLLDDEVESTEMTGVEHLGQYVYEMTQAKLAQIKSGALRVEALPQITEDMDEDVEVEGHYPEGEEAEDGVPPEELED